MTVRPDPSLDFVSVLENVTSHRIVRGRTRRRAWRAIQRIHMKRHSVLVLAAMIAAFAAWPIGQALAQAPVPPQGGAPTAGGQASPPAPARGGGGRGPQTPPPPPLTCTSK